MKSVRPFAWAEPRATQDFQRNFKLSLRVRHTRKQALGYRVGDLGFVSVRNFDH